MAFNFAMMYTNTSFFLFLPLEEQIKQLYIYCSNFISFLSFPKTFKNQFCGLLNF
jgi:hypothetical protein